MPGMSGWDVYSWMQRDPTTAGVPVVIISGEGQTPSEARARGVKEVLRKPIDLDAMLRLVERYCVRV
jgi:two-component system response regulator MprA